LASNNGAHVSASFWIYYEKWGVMRVMNFQAHIQSNFCFRDSRRVVPALVRLAKHERLNKEQMQ